MLLSQTTGELAFSLLTPDSDVERGPGTTAAELFE